MTNIPSSLLAAYQATHYRVNLPDETITLRIGVSSPLAQKLHEQNGVNSSAFLTAWNPYSNDTTEDANHTAQTELQQDLEKLNVRFLPGLGIDPASDYPGEESVLALGLDRETAIQLGKTYRQNAIVWIGQDATPELILLR